MSASFIVYEEPDGVIRLIPQVELPAAEVWLHRNPGARESLQRGIEQAGRGEIQTLGSFPQYADEE